MNRRLVYLVYKTITSNEINSNTDNMTLKKFGSKGTVPTHDLRVIRPLLHFSVLATKPRREQRVNESHVVFHLFGGQDLSVLGKYHLFDIALYCHEPLGINKHSVLFKKPQIRFVQCT